MTRDTFSPKWGESGAAVAKLPQYIDFQGLAIVRDFYVFYSTVMAGRPNVVLYELLHTGSPEQPFWLWRYRQRLSGSLVVMGGALFIPLGAIVVRVDYQMVRLAV